MKADLCMWAKDGARFLPYVLRRIDEVIPAQNVNKRIFVDDSSKDTTVEIARAFGWKVYKNVKGFVSGGAREALKHVESEFFVSVEQDVLLARNWWKKIPRYMDDPKVLVAQGIRMPTHPILYCLAEYVGRSEMGFTLDNNIFRTSLLRRLGGFPNKCPIYVDAELLDVIRKTEYKWIVDDTVVSLHIRESIVKTMHNSYKQTMLAKRKRFVGASFSSMFRAVVKSPLVGFRIASTMGCPKIFLAYPFMRLMAFKEFIHRPRRKKT